MVIMLSPHNQLMMMRFDRFASNCVQRLVSNELIYFSPSLVVFSLVVVFDAFVAFLWLRQY